MFSSEDAPGSKSVRTRARIRDAALCSFIERGYAETTMRGIAREAGVSLGSAYYYFHSKTHLVQELYERVQEDHAALAHPRLDEEGELLPRLRVVLETGLESLTPYRSIAGGFLAEMIPPDSAINPLAEESGAAREMTLALFREAITGARHSLPSDIAEALPEALFPAYLLLCLRWSYDRSAEQRSTRRMLDAALRLAAVGLPFVRLPGVHKAARELLQLLAEVRP